MVVVQHAAFSVKTCWIIKFLFGSCLARFDRGSKILCHFRQKVLNYFWSEWNKCQKTSVGHKRKSFNSSCVSVNVERVQIRKLRMQITPNGNFATTPISLKNVFTLTWGDFFLSGELLKECWQKTAIYRSHDVVFVCHLVSHKMQDVSKSLSNMERHTMTWDRN